MNKGKSILGWAIAILCVTLIIAVIPTEKEGAIYNDTIRLHIRANSDSDADQALKLEIRDRVLEKYGAALSSSQDKKTAEARITALEGDIEKDVNAWLSEAGYSYKSDVSLKNEWFGTRVYEEFTLPKGYYTSLSIELGEGSGQNWWCVMFPPLCLDMATAAPSTSYTDEESKLIEGGKYKLKFKILELVSQSLK